MHPVHLFGCRGGSFNHRFFFKSIPPIQKSRPIMSDFEIYIQFNHAMSPIYRTASAPHPQQMRYALCLKSLSPLLQRRTRPFYRTTKIRVKATNSEYKALAHLFTCHSFYCSLFRLSTRLSIISLFSSCHLLFHLDKHFDKLFTANKSHVI